jgi:NADH:ubiquinone oxidoreductase subunit E
MSIRNTETRAALHVVGEKPALDVALEEQISKTAVTCGSGREALLPVLREIRNQRGCIPSTAVAVVAQVLGVNYAKVHEVATFYSNLANMPERLPLAS